MMGMSGLLGALTTGAEVPEGWSLVWSDEFNYAGAPDPEKWTHELGGGGWGNQERQFYTDSLDNSRVEDGRLIIEVRQDQGLRGSTYTSARLITREKAQWKYGRMEARAKMPKTTGTWPAIWMLAADQLHSTSLWPDNGEIDIMEAVGYEQDPLFKAIVGDPELPNIHGTVHTTIRHAGNANGGSTFLSTASEEFHVYAINWYPDRIEFEVDGLNYFTIRRDEQIPLRNPPDDLSPYWPFDQRFFMILNVAVGGTWGGHFNTNLYPDSSPYGADGIDHDGEWPQRMEVDYVRVYAMDTPLQATAVPGMVEASDLDGGEGMLLEIAGNTESPHALAYIDAGDTAEFAVEAPANGTYRLSARTAAPLGGSTLSLEVPETGTGINDISLPATGDWQSWEETTLGDVTLQAGRNTLRLSTATGGFNLAALEVTAIAGQTWKGWPVDAEGNVNTGDFLGWINVNRDPWLFSYSLNDYFFPGSAGEPTFNTEGQWIYLIR
jgi:beta-glucanase (GH16 family)